MLYVVLFFLGFSLLLYVLLAGADFGAGIIELFTRGKNKAITKSLVYKVMGPVWEANHIWIIILIVILWIGFPDFYNQIVISLHLPLSLILLGITLRGAAFIFRHYDAYKDSSQLLYDAMFMLSSLLTPIFLGLTFGAVVGGNITEVGMQVNENFVQAYIWPWFNTFSLLVGCFFAALCAFIAAVFLIGEATTDIKKVYVRMGTIATLIVVLLGFLTLLYGYLTELQFVKGLLGDLFAICALILSGILLFPLWQAIKGGKVIQSRIYAITQVLLILFAAFVPHFPELLFTKSGTINLLDNRAPESVMSVLAISLIVGGVIILPGLFHLFKSFKMIKILEHDPD